MAIVYSLVYHGLWSGRLGVVVGVGSAGSVVGARGVRVVAGSGEWGRAVDGPMAGYRVVAPAAVRYLVVVSMSDCSCVCGCGMWPHAHG